MSEPDEYPDDYGYYEMQDEAMAEFAEQTLRDTSLENVRGYLGVYGDAIEERVRQNIGEAELILSKGHPSAALVHAATAVEITIRFLLVRPLVQGAFLSDEWAEIVASRIGTGRTQDDRQLVPDLLRQWKLDITSVKIPSGAGLWETILNGVLPRRNDVVHTGELASETDAHLALECAKTLLSGVVHEIAKNLGFTLDRTGKWCEIHKVDVAEYGVKSESWSKFKASSPFVQRSAIEIPKKKGS